jgi:hypothetical protein
MPASEIRKMTLQRPIGAALHGENVASRATFALRQLLLQSAETVVG